MVLSRERDIFMLGTLQKINFLFQIKKILNIYLRMPTSGSFVRASKANFGIDILEAAKLKYLCNDESSADNVEEFLYNTSR